METHVRTLATISSKSFSAHLDEVELRTGKRSQRIRVQHPLAAAVIPFVGQDRLLMVRQYRYAIAKETLEIPAGKVDPGESSEHCARRELVEETGYEAGLLTRRFSFYPAIGYSNEVIDIYEARDLNKIRDAVDEAEISRVEIVAVDALLDLVAREAIMDAKTVLAACLLCGCLIREQGRSACGGTYSNT